VTTMVALLRSVNVGGRNRVPMAELRAMVETLGFEGVQTYVQSGNVVLTGTGSASSVARTVQEGIAETFGLDVPVIVRSTRQLTRILTTHPFAVAGVDPKTVHVTFLATAPTANQAKALAKVGTDAERDGSFGDDRFVLDGTEVYLHCPAGYGETKFNNAFFERRAAVVATTRNWKTVTTLATMARLDLPEPKKG
jgi:uncharacterized protein (DUF1697 family)